MNGSFIYWGGDTGTTIGRARLNGTGVNQNFITTAGGLCGITVSRTYIYWADYRTDAIGRARLNGSGINQDFITTVGAPGVAINKSYIYWTNSNGTIGRAKLNGSAVNQQFIKGVTGDAFLALTGSFIYWTDYKSDTGTTIGRARLNGTAVDNRFISGASAPFGIAVTPQADIDDASGHRPRSGTRASTAQSRTRLQQPAPEAGLLQPDPAAT